MRRVSKTCDVVKSEDVKLQVEVEVRVEFVNRGGVLMDSDC